MAGTLVTSSAPLNKTRYLISMNKPRANPEFNTFVFRIFTWRNSKNILEVLTNPYSWSVPSQDLNPGSLGLNTYL